MKVNEHYVVKVLAGESVLVHQDAHNVDFSKIITLNETGLLIFQKIQEGADLDETVKAITEEYDIDDMTARKDATAFVDKLKKMGIVHD